MLRSLVLFIGGVLARFWRFLWPPSPAVQRAGDPPPAEPLPRAAEAPAAEVAAPRAKPVPRVVTVYYFQLRKGEPVPNLETLTPADVARRMATQGGGGGRD